jgi:hypothetical protein
MIIPITYSTLTISTFVTLPRSGIQLALMDDNRKEILGN